MPVTAISPGPVTPISQGIVYALPGSPCVIFTGVACERAALYSGPFTAWAGSTSGAYNHVGGFVRCQSGNTTIQALKVKMDGSVYLPGSSTPVRDDDAAYSAVVMSDRPSYYWSLNDESELVAVESVSGANGTISGGVTLNQAGAVGKSMLFDGVAGTRITIPPPITIGLGSVSIECWIKTTVNQGFKYVVDFKNNGASAYPGVGFLTGGGGQLYLDIVNGTTGASIGTTFNYYDGNWHHLVGVLIRGTSDIGKLYIDGVEIYQAGSPTAGISLTSNVAAGIGSYSSGAANNFTGTIDEVAIYPYALSPAQIQSHYLAKNVPPNSYASAVMKSGPTNYWQMDEEGGLVANDLVGGKHGTISGGVTLGQAGIGKSMLFDGSTGKIITTPITITPTTSFEWWFKTTNGADITFWGIPLAASNDRILVNTNIATQITLQIYHASIAQVSTPTSAGLPVNLRDGNWHHLVLVFPGNKTMQLFLDGVSRNVDNLPLQQALVNQITEFQIGHHSNFVTWWNGNLDEVAIYNRALTATEIQSHFLAKFGITNPSSYAAKVALSGASNYWPLNDSSGTTAVDVIGNATGTISGGVTLNQSGVGNSKAMTFDGTTGKIVTASAVTIPVVCTIEIWGKTVIGAYRTGISNRTAGGTGDNVFAGVTGNMEAYVSGQSGNDAFGSKVLNTDWHHLVFVLNGTTAVIYTDGVFDVSRTLLRTLSGQGILGISDDNGFYKWNGSLQDVAIYPRALSATEIAQHYSARLA